MDTQHSSPDHDTSQRSGTGEGLASIVRSLHAAQRRVLPSELLFASADDSDAPLEPAVPALLALVRSTLQMDVVFVSEFVDGQRVFKHVDVPAAAPVIAVGGADPLEASWCVRIVDGRLPRFIADASVHIAKGDVAPAPFPIGTHLSVPIVLRDGTTFGTLCCFSFTTRPEAGEADLALLTAIAGMLAAAENRRQLKGRGAEHKVGTEDTRQ